MTDKIALHYRYNMFYLLLLCFASIIVLTTTKWGAIPELAQLISFGLTLTSLFLSLIAIIFAIVSNNSYTQSTAILQSTSSNISDMSNKLRTVIDDIDSKIALIPAMIQGVGETVTKHQSELLARLDEKRMPQITDETPILNKDIISKFMDASSYTGLILLYGCKLAFDAKKVFKLEAFKFLDSTYSFGFLVASSAAGLVDYKTEAGGYGIINLNEHLSKSIEQAVYDKARSLFGESDQVATLKECMDEIATIKAHFEGKDIAKESNATNPTV